MGNVSSNDSSSLAGMLAAQQAAQANAAQGTDAAAATRSTAATDSITRSDGGASARSSITVSADRPNLPAPAGTAHPSPGAWLNGPGIEAKVDLQKLGPQLAKQRLQTQLTATKTLEAKVDLNKDEQENIEKKGMSDAAISVAGAAAAGAGAGAGATKLVGSIKSDRSEANEMKQLDTNKGAEIVGAKRGSEAREAFEKRQGEIARLEAKKNPENVSHANPQAERTPFTPEDQAKLTKLQDKQAEVKADIHKEVASKHMENRQKLTAAADTAAQGVQVGTGLATAGAQLVGAQAEAARTADQTYQGMMDTWGSKLDESAKNAEEDITAAYANLDKMNTKISFDGKG